MTSLFITEYTRFAEDSGGRAMNVGLEPGTDQAPVAVGGSSVQSAVFAGTTKLIRVHSDTTCRIAIGTNPTATSNNKRVVAGATEYFGVRGGDQLAVIAGS